MDLIKLLDVSTPKNTKNTINNIIQEFNNTPPGAGGVTSWNDLTDKPFGELPPLFDITWDGNMEGHEVVDEGEGAYSVKVSDEVFTKEQLLNSTTFISDGYEVINTEENISVDEEFGAIFIDGGMVIFSAEKFNSAAELPEGTFSNGVWFMNRTGEEPAYANRLVATTIIKTIDEKYIPDTIATKEDVAEAIANTDTEISWNDITDKPFEVVSSPLVHLVSNSVSFSAKPTDGKWNLSTTFNFVPEDGKTYLVRIFDQMFNTAIFIEARLVGQLGSLAGIPAYFLGNKNSKIYGTSTNGKNWTFSFYLTGVISNTLVVRISEGGNYTIPLSDKYLPDSVVLESELEAKGYQTEAQVQALIEAKGYQNREQVQALIDASIENGGGTSSNVPEGCEEIRVGADINYFDTFVVDASNMPSSVNYEDIKFTDSSGTEYSIGRGYGNMAGTEGTGLWYYDSMTGPPYVYSISVTSGYVEVPVSTLFGSGFYSTVTSVNPNSGIYIKKS